jgi:C_GCAxxG_C_C family probable redox protein
VVQAYYGLEGNDLWQMATGLGAGVSRRGFLCGALNGGALACGLVVGSRRGTGRDDLRGLREETYAKVQELSRRFEARFGAVDCMAMTGCDFLTAEGQAKFREQKLLDSVCRPAVALVVEQAIDILG